MTGAVALMLANVAPSTVSALRAGRRFRDFTAGETIIDGDVLPPCIYHLLDGRAKAWRSGHDGHLLVLAFMVTGDVIGAIPTVRGRPGPATITAVTATRTECWPAPLFQRLLRDDPQLAANVGKMIAERFSMLIERLTDLTSGRVDQQLARILLRLASEEGAWAETEHVVVPATRQDLADMAGTTLHTASRVLSGWGEQGLVESTRGAVTIRDPDRLVAVADLAA